MFFAEIKAFSLFFPQAELLTCIYYVLTITSLISIWQFFSSKVNRSIFQLFNMIFFLIFYLFSISFLLLNKGYYDGYEKVDNVGYIWQLFFPGNVYSLLPVITIVAFVINVAYIFRRRRQFLLQ
jgi:hypothetical protein